MFTYVVRPSISTFQNLIQKSHFKWKYWSILARLWVWPNGSLSHISYFQSYGKRDKMKHDLFSAQCFEDANSEPEKNCWHHQFYQWVALVLVLQAGAFYFPRLMIHEADPQSRPVVITIFTYVPVSTFQNLAKQNKVLVKIVIAKGKTVGLT